MRFVAKVGDWSFVVGVPDDGPLQAITIDDREVPVSWRHVGEDTTITSDRAAHFSLLAGLHSYDTYIRQVPAEDAGTGERVLEVHLGGAVYQVRVADERTRALASLASGQHVSGDVAIRAPMPGLVSSILVEEGAHVERGHAVVVLEAMKMENDLTAPRAGIVKSIRVSKGQTVNQGDLLAVVGDPEGAVPEDDTNGK